MTIKLIESHIVPVLPEKIRLSDYCGGKFSIIPSRKGMKKAIQNKLVKVNNEISDTGKFLTGGETIELYEKENSKPIYDLKIEIIYEDDFIAIINKPPGITVSGNKFKTVENALPYNLKVSTQTDSLPRSLPIHRLDHPTSGLLMIAKTRNALSHFKKMFKERAIKKTYVAITIGKMKKEGIIDSLIDNKPSYSQYEVIDHLESKKYNGLNLVKLNLKTGRRHQLRKHLSSIGNPIFGDKEYGIEGFISYGSGMYLHSAELSFKHPFTEKKIDLKCSIPKKFKKIFPDF